MSRQLLLLASFIVAPIASAQDEAQKPERPRPFAKLFGKKDAATENMVVKRDVVYTKMEGVAPKLHSLDVYMPKPKSGDDTPTANQRAEKHPILVMIHGGGWRNGDKTNPGVVEEKAKFFTAHDYVFISINYRLSPDHLHPAHIEDVAAAVAFVYRHATEYGADPDNLFVMGHSAGAHLAALVSVDERRLGAHQLPLSVIKGAILLDGAAYDVPESMKILPPNNPLRKLYLGAFGDDPTAWADASPITHVGKNKSIPPFLAFYTGGRVLASSIGESLIEKLKGCGVAARLVESADQSHGEINSEFGTEGDMVTRETMAFLDALLAPITATKARGIEADSTEPKKAPRDV